MFGSEFNDMNGVVYQKVKVNGKDADTKFDKQNKKITLEVGLNIIEVIFDRLLYFNSMFQSCTDIISLDLSNLVIPNSYSANQMFSQCTNLKSLDLSNFDT